MHISTFSVGKRGNIVEEENKKNARVGKGENRNMWGGEEKKVEEEESKLDKLLIHQ